MTKQSNRWLSSMLLCWLAVSASSLGAQTDIELVIQRDSLLKYRFEDRFDHGYLQDLTHLLAPRFFLLQNSQPIAVSVARQSFGAIVFTPNLPISVGGGVYYKWLGVQLGFPFQAFAAPDNERGRTRSFILAASASLRRFGIDGHYTRYTGFYVNNTRSLLGQSVPPYALRPDISTEAVGANIYYIFNYRRFSFRAAFIQTERQRRSAGSLLLMPTFNYFNVSGDSAITRVPGLEYVGTPDGLTLRSASSISVGLIVGYAHTFVFWKSGYFLAAFLPGLTGGINRYTLEDGTTRSRERINVRAHLRFSLGFNGPRWFGGLNSLNDFYNLNLTSDVQLLYVYSRTQLFIGCRLEAPRQLAKVW